MCVYQVYQAGRTIRDDICYNKIFQEVVLEGSWDAVHTVPENGTVFSSFGKTVSLTFLESSVLLFIL